MKTLDERIGKLTNKNQIRAMRKWQQYCEKKWGGRIDTDCQIKDGIMWDFNTGYYVDHDEYDTPKNRDNGILGVRAKNHPWHAAYNSVLPRPE